MNRTNLMGPARAALVAVALATTLAGCDQIRQATGMDQGANITTTNSTNSVAPLSTVPPPSIGAPATGGTPAKPAGVYGNPALASEIAEAAQRLTPQLPITVDAVTSVTGVHADGTELIYEMTVTTPIPPAQTEAFRQALQTQNQANLCRDANVSGFIRRGGSMNHRYSDPSGFRFETRVVAC